MRTPSTRSVNHRIITMMMAMVSTWRSSTSPSSTSLTSTLRCWSWSGSSSLQQSRSVRNNPKQQSIHNYCAAVIAKYLSIKSTLRVHVLPFTINNGFCYTNFVDIVVKRKSRLTQPIWQWHINVTDGRTNGRLQYRALHHVYRTQNLHVKFKKY